MTEQQAMQMALEALEYQGPSEPLLRNKAIIALRQALKQPADEPVAWDEPTPDFYISELSRNTIRYHNAVHGQQDFSKNRMNNCVVPVWFTRPQPKTERYFCERCGKRLFDGIHTCTPPTDTLKEIT
jgi:hypothetical protein